MTHENNEQNNDETEGSELVDKDRKRINLRSAAGIVVVVIVGAVALFNTRSIMLLKNDNTQLDIINQQRTNIDRLVTDFVNIQSQMQEMEFIISDLEQALDQTNESLQTLYLSQNSQENSLSISEIEHLIKIANIKIKLEYDINAAIISLEEANDRLASLGDPALFGVRRLLTADINALRSVPQADIAGMTFTLSDIISRIGQLPLKETAVTGGETAIFDTDPNLPAWKQLLTGIWQEFKSMFIITRTDEGMSTSLLPSEKYFLYQNIRLQLETSRLAILQRDALLLEDSLNSAEAWLNEYFDNSDTAVRHILQTINDIKGENLNPMLPDISASIEALNEYIINSQGIELPGAEADQL